jgi:TPP-dependent 2-oxoacid decarboxylase
LDEALPQFLGIYMGNESIPQGLQQVVETADLVLDLGEHVNEHINTVLDVSDTCALSHPYS